MMLEDAEHYGVIGLLLAADRYKPERGIQFATYATWWIRQCCQRYGPDAARFIRIPQYAFWPCFRLGIELQNLRRSRGPNAVRDELIRLFDEEPETELLWRIFDATSNVSFCSDRNHPDHREWKSV